jgi:hypothetical protein
MTPKEKAKELVEKYLRTYPIYDNPSVVISYTYNEAKQCALIAVDEILKRTRSVDTMPPNYQKIDENTKEYWQEVKQEIENYGK